MSLRSRCTFATMNSDNELTIPSIATEANVLRAPGDDVHLVKISRKFFDTVGNRSANVLRHKKCWLNIHHVLHADGQASSCRTVRSKPVKIYNTGTKPVVHPSEKYIV